jgi:drug/metabolite transporter (DMT)-like permease
MRRFRACVSSNLVFRSGTSAFHFGRSDTIVVLIAASDRRPIVVWWVACILWSSTFLFIKVGVAEIPPLTFASLRLFVALCVLAPLSARLDPWRALRWSDGAVVACAGVILLGINYALLFWGAQFISSGLIAIIQSGTPLVALVFAWGFGLERLTIRKLAALALGIAGAVVIFRTQASASGFNAAVGCLAVFGSSACVAFAYVWLKRRGGAASPLMITTIQSASALIPLTLFALLLEGRPAAEEWSAAAWAALLYLALCASVLAFWLNYWLLARMDASVMLMMGVAEVPIAVGLAAVTLGERLTGSTIAGALCILVAVVVRLKDVQRSAHRDHR